ncbi:MAG TPA: inner membrane CreD family protein [Candidatus Polarisedimenticolaceae bacterium]|nr:inner membrane CreD family protein [Candidatus Polarisedimenticolaceae bacterium]
MTRRIVPILGIFLCVTAAWMALGGSVNTRTRQTDGHLKEAVSSLWGSAQTQVAPEVSFTWRETEQETEVVKDAATGLQKVVTHEKEVWRSKVVLLDRSKIDVDLHLDQRKKGLLWYSTYAVSFRGSYAYTHVDDREGWLILTYRFPTTQAIYSDFRFAVNGVVEPQTIPVGEDGARVVRQKLPVRKGTLVPFEIAYRSRGLDTWAYSFGEDVNRVKDFDLSVATDFDAIDFPEKTISPDQKTRNAGGWTLRWRSENLISGFSVGVEMPHRLNPGPLAAEMSFFAPVSLGFFFIWIFVITLMKKIDLHPMNYLFLAAAFFAFHLLFAYTVDHIDVVPAFVLASAVSMFLVVTYLRLVVGLRFAALEAAGSQLVYLVLFSWAHFFEGFTGLIVTVGSILTLFLLMQLTGRIKWEEKLGTAPVRA